MSSSTLLITGYRPHYHLDDYACSRLVAARKRARSRYRVADFAVQSCSRSVVLGMQQVHAPQQVADCLGLSTSMVRKYSQVFEKFKGKLPRDNRNGRLYAQEHLAIFQEVNELIKDGYTLEEAMLRASSSVDSDVPAATLLEAGGTEVLLLLKRLVEVAEEQSRKIERLEREIQTLRALPSSQAPEVQKSYEDLAKRHNLLLQSLTNKDVVIEQLRARPWWRLW